MTSVNGTVDNRGSPVHAPRRVGAPVVLSAEAPRELRHWPVAVQALHRRLLVVRFPALLPPPKDQIAPGVRTIVRSCLAGNRKVTHDVIDVHIIVNKRKRYVTSHESTRKGAGRLIF